MIFDLLYLGFSIVMFYALILLTYCFEERSSSSKLIAMLKRWCRSRKNIVIVFIIIFLIAYYIGVKMNVPKTNYDLARRVSIIQHIEDTIQDALKEEKGMGCKIPQLDPFSKEIMALEKNYSKVTCPGSDWVKCYHSQCRVLDHILNTYDSIQCKYKDIVYRNDSYYEVKSQVTVSNDDIYTLEASDHVKVECSGYKKGSFYSMFPPIRWKGHGIGFRKMLSPLAREDLYDVLYFGFDSTSKNGFIRKMPKSYKYITETLKSTILNGYNVLGDGTPAALFPILSGKNELEFPDARKKISKNTFLDSEEFIFLKLRKFGYRTAYFEDSPSIGTFQYRFNGFNKRPADHYLRAFLQEEKRTGQSADYCVGDTPLYKIMMNITDQFLTLQGRHFCFTFVADICHNDFGRISTADEDLVEFLDRLYQKGTFDNTLLIVFGDHGPRYASVRQTLNGKFEERLPLMSIRLPDTLKSKRPEAQANLESNVHVLTTAHDVHATVLDVLELGQLRNSYEVKGADIMRGLSLLEPVPLNRSCSEAGIEPHWCSCVEWRAVPLQQPVCGELVRRFLEYVNQLTQPYRDKCAERMLKSIEWVKRQVPKSSMVTFVEAIDYDGYIGKFNKNAMVDKGYYQLRVILGPGDAIYEASAMYYKKENKFLFHTQDISRISMYRDEPACISASHPELNPFCYCNY